MMDSGSISSVSINLRAVLMPEVPEYMLCWETHFAESAAAAGYTGRIIYSTINFEYYM